MSRNCISPPPYHMLGGSGIYFLFINITYVHICWHILLIYMSNWTFVCQIYVPWRRVWRWLAFGMLRLVVPLKLTTFQRCCHHNQINMEEVNISETSVSFCGTRGHNIPEDSHHIDICSSLCRTLNNIFGLLSISSTRLGWLTDWLFECFCGFADAVVANLGVS
jgi:hypothetical protein